jgi:hypothetical protein
MTQIEARQLVTDAYEAHRRALYFLASHEAERSPRRGVSWEVRTTEIADQALEWALANMREEREPDE